MVTTGTMLSAWVSQADKHSAFLLDAHEADGVQDKCLYTACTDSDRLPYFVCAQMWVNICMDVDVNVEASVNLKESQSGGIHLAF